MVGGIRRLPDLHGVNYSEMRWIADSLGIRVSSANLPKGTSGLYRDTDQRILLELNMTYRQKRCALAHELMHWRRGDQTCSTCESCRQERRARRDTALALIDPVDYATAESVCDGDPSAIAEELEVTKQVLEDWRDLLHDGMLPPPRR